MWRPFMFCGGNNVALFEFVSLPLLTHSYVTAPNNA